VLLIYGNLAKFNRQHFFSSIEEVVRLNKENLAPGLIQIIVNQSPQTVFEFYEPNYLMYKATGKASWFTKINNTIDDNFLLPCFFKNKDIYYQQFIYNKNNSNNLTQTAIILDVKGFIGFTAMINNTFNLKGKGTVNLVSINKLKNINLSNCTL
jgi:hypothetical protein